MVDGMRIAQSMESEGDSANRVNDDSFFIFLISVDENLRINKITDNGERSGRSLLSQVVSQFEIQSPLSSPTPIERCSALFPLLYQRSINRARNLQIELNSFEAKITNVAITSSVTSTHLAWLPYGDYSKNPIHFYKNINYLLAEFCSDIKNLYEEFRCVDGLFN